MSVATLTLGAPPMGDLEERPASVVRAGLAAALSCAAAAWMTGGAFRDPTARGVAVGAVLLGAGLVIAGYRLGQSSLLQLLVLPAALLAGALLVLPDARGGSATIPSLVTEAVAAGGLPQAPVPFDPGWRLVLVVVFAPLAATAASLAISLARPRLGVADLDGRHFGGYAGSRRRSTRAQSASPDARRRPRTDPRGRSRRSRNAVTDEPKDTSKVSVEATDAEKVGVDPTDVELVRAYRNGDTHAFEELHRRYVASI